MASSPQSFNKRQRERAKKEKAAAKRARRHSRDPGQADDDTPDEDALLEQFRLLNEQRAAGEVDDEEFEARKQEIFVQLGLGEG